MIANAIHNLTSPTTFLWNTHLLTPRLVLDYIKKGLHHISFVAKRNSKKSSLTIHENISCIDPWKRERHTSTFLQISMNIKYSFVDYYPSLFVKFSTYKANEWLVQSCTGVLKYQRILRLPVTLAGYFCYFVSWQISNEFRQDCGQRLTFTAANNTRALDMFKNTTLINFSW